MGHSRRLRLRDIREIHQLVSFITEFGDRPGVWRGIALDGLTRLLRGNVGLTVDFQTPPDATPIAVDPLDTGWQVESLRRRYTEYLAQELEQDPSFTRLLAMIQHRRFVTITRHELLDDRTWYASSTVSQGRRMCDVNDFVVTIARVSPRSLHGFIIYRPWNARPFAAHERCILRLFHVELARAIREGNSPHPIRGAIPHLSPRLNQTLHLLLTDRSLKEIAADLDLSYHTVNGYQKVLYRLFQVQKRSALVAMFRPMKKGFALPEGLMRELRG